jgi:hypothetical protein
VLHLPPHAFQHGLAGDENSPALLQLVAQPGLVEPQAAEEFGLLPHEHAQERLARSRVPQIDLVDHARDTGQLSFLELVDGPQLAHVLIGPREVEQHVRRVVQVELRQQFCPLRPDALQKLHRRRELRRGRVNLVSGHKTIIHAPRG